MHIACEAAICMLRLRYVCDMYATFCDMYARLRYVCYGFSCPPMHEHHLLPLTLLRCAKGVPAEIALLGDSFRNILRTFFSAETHPLYGILFFEKHEEGSVRILADFIQFSFMIIFTGSCSKHCSHFGSMPWALAKVALPRSPWKA